MKLTMCACGAEHLERIPRSWWMRLFTSRRHYQCSQCGATLFVRKPPLRVNAMVPLRTAPPGADPAP